MENSKTGYIFPTQKSDVKRFCQTLDLKSDPALIEEYKYWHMPQNRWPEIPRGIREVGVLNMEIYIFENRLFMIVETPVDFVWDEAFAKLALLDRQAEWENFMSKFQVSSEHATSSDKWQLMDRIFKL